MQSLQKQLQRNMLLTLILVLAVMLALVHTGVQKITRDYVSSRLQHDAESIIAALQKNATGNWQIDTSRLPAVYLRVKSGHYFRVVGDTTDIRSRSLWDHVPVIAPAQPDGHSVYNFNGHKQEHWQSWRQDIHKNDTVLTVWVAEDVSRLMQTREKYSLWAGGILLLSVLILMLVQHWILRRGFHKLDNVRDAIKAIHAGDFTAITRNMPLEVQPLVKEIERLLIRLEQRVSRSRNALGNLAHEMKRPLQHLRLLADQLPDNTLQELHHALDGISLLVERELKRARIVGTSSPGRQTVLDREIPTLIQLLQKIHPAITIRADYIHNLVLPHDRDDMLELLGNLLDNACKYGGGIVYLAITEQPDRWKIQVDDNGPGIPGNALQHIATRGTRLDESRAGSGLGLSICSDIVQSYGGTLHFITLQENAGFRVEVILPISQPTE